MGETELKGCIFLANFLNSQGYMDSFSDKNRTGVKANMLFFEFLLPSEKCPVSLLLLGTFAKAQQQQQHQH